MLRFDARLVTSDLQMVWLAQEKQIRKDELDIKLAMMDLGIKNYPKGISA